MQLFPFLHATFIMSAYCAVCKSVIKRTCFRTNSV